MNKLKNLPFLGAGASALFCLASGGAAGAAPLSLTHLEMSAPSAVQQIAYCHRHRNRHDKSAKAVVHDEDVSEIADEISDVAEERNIVVDEPTIVVEVPVAIDNYYAYAYPPYPAYPSYPSYPVYSYDYSYGADYGYGARGGGDFITAGLGGLFGNSWNGYGYGRGWAGYRHW